MRFGRRRDAGTSALHGGIDIAAEGSGVTIGIRYRILNARLAAGAVSAGQGGGVAYDGWRVVSQIEWQEKGWPLAQRIYGEPTFQFAMAAGAAEYE